MRDNAPTTIDSQAGLFAELAGYEMTDNLERTTDYYLWGIIKGIEYWIPNDEEWFDIIAIDRPAKLAHFTEFCEMADFEADDSDYVIVNDNGRLVCKFEASTKEKFDWLVHDTDNMDNEESVPSTALELLASLAIKTELEKEGLDGLVHHVVSALHKALKGTLEGLEAKVKFAEQERDAALALARRYEMEQYKKL